MSLYRDRGVVLRTYRLGEADRIIVLLTEDHGKVRAVAKGVRRTSSRFGARLEPLSHAACMFWQGRGDLDTVNQVEVIDAHQRIREDLDRVAQGMSLLEVADQISQERHPDPALYAMLVGALRVLDDLDRPSDLVAPAFFLKALVLDGAGPILDCCAACGAVEADSPLVAFSMLDGGVLCRDCRRGRPIGPEALDLLRRILGGTLGEILASVPPACTEEVRTVTTEAMEMHLDRRLKSVRSVASF